jgi:hypothetical protein
MAAPVSGSIAIASGSPCKLFLALKPEVPYILTCRVHLECIFKALLLAYDDTVVAGVVISCGGAFLLRSPGEDL